MLLWPRLPENLPTFNRTVVRLGTLLVVALLRIPPASPFALANFVLAAARVSLGEYVLGTLIGIAPRTALTTFAGAGLEQLRFDNVQDRWMVVAGVVATIVVCVVLGILANRALRRVAKVRE